MRFAIVGAGIVGRLLAWQLSQLDCSITIYDSNATGCGADSCSYTAAGMLANIAELERGERLLYELGLLSISLWQQWLQHLSAEPLLHINGSLVIAHPQNANELIRFIAQIKRKLNDSTQLEIISAEQLSQLEPDITNNMQALFLKEEAQLDNHTILKLLYSTLQIAKVSWKLNSKVTTVKPYQIMLQQQTFDFDWVFDCRGLAAKQDIAGLRGVRGELILLHSPEIKITRPVRVLHPRYRIYCVPKAAHHYIIGATEIECEDFSPISVRSTLELLNAAYLINPGFCEARIISSSTQCRPAFNNHLPKIISTQGLTAINGLFRHGYLLAPALIQQVIQVIFQNQQGDNRLWQLQN